MHAVVSHASTGAAATQVDDFALAQILAGQDASSTIVQQVQIFSGLARTTPVLADPPPEPVEKNAFNMS